MSRYCKHGAMASDCADPECNPETPSGDWDLRLVRLLPCPFCAKDAELMKYEDREYDEDFCCPAYPWYVACKGLNCSAVIPFYKNGSDVVEAWNKRSLPNSEVSQPRSVDNTRVRV